MNLPIQLEMSPETVSGIESDWIASRPLPVKIWLQEASHKYEFIGWYGEFTDDEELQTLDGEFINGFCFESGGVMFFGAAGIFGKAIEQLDRKRLVYKGDGKVFVRNKNGQRGTGTNGFGA